MTIKTLDETWNSVASQTSLQDTCTNFHWVVTDISGQTGSGVFTTTCYGNVNAIGTATGTVSGTDMTWSATATGVSPSLPSCAITLSGTASLEPSQIRVPFTGTTCIGSVAGGEILR